MLGSNTRADSLHKRISFLTILLAGILLYWLWEAQLISYFSFPVKSLPFNNLEEFLAKSDDKVLPFNNINEYISKTDYKVSNTKLNTLGLLLTGT